MVNQIHPYPSDDDSFWILAVSASSGRDARILDDSAHEHGTHSDAQGHMIEAHGTRSVYTRLGPEGQSVGAEFGVTNVKTPTLSMEKFVTQSYCFEAGLTGCKMSKGGSQRHVGFCKESILFGWTSQPCTTAE